MLTLYLAIMAGGVAGLVPAITGYQPANVPRGLLLIWLNGILLLNVTLLGGTQLSTLANGVLVFAAFGVAFVGGFFSLYLCCLGAQPLDGRLWGLLCCRCPRSGPVAL